MNKDNKNWAHSIFQRLLNRAKSNFDGEILSEAIKNTFSQRRTALPNSVPFAFTSDFSEDQQKKVQWDAFVRQAKPNVPRESVDGNG